MRALEKVKKGKSLTGAGVKYLSLGNNFNLYSRHITTPFTGTVPKSLSFYPPTYAALFPFQWLDRDLVR